MVYGQYTAAESTLLTDGRIPDGILTDGRYLMVFSDVIINNGANH